MKKLLYFSLTLMIISGTITSCGKTTKGKFADEWIVTSYTKTTTNDTIETISKGNSSKTPYTLTIRKDGTWEENWGVSSSALIFGGSIHATTQINEKQSGTWNFMEKIKGESERNERVMFNTLFESKVEKYTGSPATTPMFGDTTITSSQSYATGEKYMVYTVEKSTRDELHLASDKEVSSQGTTFLERTRIVLQRK